MVQIANPYVSTKYQCTPEILIPDPPQDIVKGDTVAIYGGRYWDDKQMNKKAPEVRLPQTKGGLPLFCKLIGAPGTKAFPVQSSSQYTPRPV